MNTLYYGDNLDILKRYIKDAAVDLIYLDPPFNSNASYNVLFSDRKGEKSAAQLQAFKDTWAWAEAALTYEELTLESGPMGDALRAFGQLLPRGGMLAYLTMMAPRLRELHRVLKPTGSIYLHCDPTASHYLKVLMDAIFGVKQFRNEIVWHRYKRPKGSQFAARKFGASTDSILYYTKTDKYEFYPDRIRVPLDDEELRVRYPLSDAKGPYSSGPLLRSASMGARPNLVYEYKGYTPGPEGWRLTKDKLRALDEQGDMFWTSNGVPRRKVRPEAEPGQQIGNLWTDIEAIGSQAAERLGYPTQKPEALLERIIRASSNEGDVVLDPFCGCGTAIAVSQRLNRQWLGIDITYAAIQTIKMRLAAFDGIKYETRGEPVSLSDAQKLAQEDPYQFQWWSLGLVGARPDAQKKGADKGIDGKLYFQDGAAREIIISVKGGRVHSNVVSELVGVVQRENAAIGVLITMYEPTAPMRAEAASAGFYQSQWGRHPRIQILTVAELLQGKGIDYPNVTGGNITYKQAPRVKGDAWQQPKLTGES